MYVINIPHLRWVCTGLGKKAFLVSFQNYPKQVTKRRKKKEKKKKKKRIEAAATLDLLLVFRAGESGWQSPK